MLILIAIVLDADLIGDYFDADNCMVLDCLINCTCFGLLLISFFFFFY